VGVVLQAADRLDAIGAIGIARCMGCAQAMVGPESRFYHPEDPLAAQDRPLDDRRYAVDHFKAKLLKLTEGMHLPTARREAQLRHDTMIAWLDALQREIESTADSV